MSQPWNVNIHYDGKLDDSVPEQATSVLDVGCGDGFLAARLARRVKRVVAIDVDAPVLERAKQRFPDAPVDWRRADILDAEGLGTYDAVVSNAALHHLPDTRDGLRRMRAHVRPGGVLGVVAFAAPGIRHLPWAIGTSVTRFAAIQLRGKWEHTAPTVWPPRDTVTQLRRHVRAELPGATVSLLALGRVFILWRAPA